MTSKKYMLWLPEDQLEKDALNQIKKVASLPWVHKHVAVMPDAHAGKGCTVGSVIAMNGAVCPACVGVDIGCGMLAAKTNLSASDLPDNLKAIRESIESVIPVGFNYHKIPIETELFLFEDFTNLSFKNANMLDIARKQLGTLGGGNHFIEICLDTNQNVWIMLHSGSRKIGKEIADFHISTAKNLAHNDNVIDPDLASFLAGTLEMKNYRNDLVWSQTYAKKNREVIFDLCVKELKKFFNNLFIDKKNIIDCHHNYVAEEFHFGSHVFVTRKGAISAQNGEMGIIPGSMGAKSFIVKGLGNPDSFNSASHGAGRKISRSQAKKQFNVRDLIKQTQGVECRKDISIVDEIPSCYKDIDIVMSNQKDLVEIVFELKQILCIKG